MYDLLRRKIENDECNISAILKASDNIVWLVISNLFLNRGCDSVISIFCNLLNHKDTITNEMFFLEPLKYIFAVSVLIWIPQSIYIKVIKIYIFR